MYATYTYMHWTHTHLYVYVAYMNWCVVCVCVCVRVCVQFIYVEDIHEVIHVYPHSHIYMSHAYT